MVHHAGEDAGLAAVQAERVDPGVFGRLPRAFQQQAQLRVEAARLARADAEELGVELGGAGEEAALPSARGAGAFGVGVVDALEVPAAVRGEGGDRIGAARDQLPEVARRGDATGEAAAHADDRDRLVDDVLQLAIALAQLLLLLQRGAQGGGELLARGRHRSSSRPRESAPRPATARSRAGAVSGCSSASRWAATAVGVG